MEKGDGVMSPLKRGGGTESRERDGDCAVSDEDRVGGFACGAEAAIVWRWGEG
jgi:hypothetical protein